eukprot:g37365.t1
MECLLRHSLPAHVYTNRSVLASRASHCKRSANSSGNSLGSQTRSVVWKWTLCSTTPCLLRCLTAKSISVIWRSLFSSTYKLVRNDRRSRAAAARHRSSTLSLWLGQTNPSQTLTALILLHFKDYHFIVLLILIPMNTVPIFHTIRFRDLYFNTLRDEDFGSGRAEVY